MSASVLKKGWKERRHARRRAAAAVKQREGQQNHSRTPQVGIAEASTPAKTSSTSASPRLFVHQISRSAPRVPPPLPESADTCHAVVVLRCFTKASVKWQCAKYASQRMGILARASAAYRRKAAAVQKYSVPRREGGSTGGELPRTGHAAWSGRHAAQSSYSSQRGARRQELRQSDYAHPDHQVGALYSRAGPFLLRPFRPCACSMPA